MAADRGTGMVIKNTFIEVGDPQTDWRRQMSAPGATFQRQMSELTSATGLSDLDPAMLCTRDTSGTAEASQEEGSSDRPTGSEGSILAAKMAHAIRASPAANDSADEGQKPHTAQVLSLAETIPRGRKAKDGRAAAAERKEARTRDSQINQIKNFDITHKEPPWTDVTTVMMRNLPNKYTQQMLLDELQDSGFRAGPDFDFFYLPMDHSNAANLGYCFINFTATAMANAFAAAFQLKKMRRFNSNKTVVVMPASIQGYEKNHAYYSSTRVVQADDPQYRPLFMKPSAGNEGAFSRSGGKAAARGAQAVAGGGADKRGAKARGGNRDGGLFPDPQFGATSFQQLDPYAAGMAPVAPLLGTWPQPAASPPAKVRCQSCGSMCSSAHRFCAFCGSEIKGTMLRADAPTFVMPPGGEPQPSAPRGPPLVSLSSPEAQVGSSATDEADVMRGRMMLLAALEEMENPSGKMPVF